MVNILNFKKKRVVRSSYTKPFLSSDHYLNKTNLLKLMGIYSGYNVLFNGIYERFEN